MNRRGLIAGLFALAVAAPAALVDETAAATGSFDFLRLRRKARVQKALRQQATSRISRRKPVKRLASAKKPKRRSRV